MTEKNCEYIGKVSDIGMNGEGVIIRDDKVVFVPFAIKDETVSYKVLKTENKIAYGKLLKVIEPSLFREQPVCPVYGKCGGCSFQHINYKKTLQIKRQTVANAFSKIAYLNVDVNDTIPSKNIYGYRNKLQLPLQKINGEPIIGFYASNSHRIVPIIDCPINPEWTKKIISVFKKYLSLEGVNAFDPVKSTGNVKEITVKYAGGLFITVVCATSKLERQNDLINLLKESFDEFSLYINVNPKNNNVIYGDKFIHIFGAKNFDCELNGIKFKSEVKSFLQVNDDICVKLYEKAVEEVIKDSPEIVFDAYSGVGITTAMLAKRTGKVYGIEIVDEAVKTADKVAKLNGLSDKIKNFCGKTEDILPDLIKNATGKTAMLLDPPRKGCDEAVLKAIIDSKPERIVYVSCMPSTLARDVGVLCGTLKFADKGLVKSETDDGIYRIQSVTPFDMFPQTKHIETVCVLIKA